MRFRLSVSFRAVLCAAVLLIPSAASSKAPPDSFADLTQQLLPTVVYIATTQTLNAAPNRNGGGPDLPPGSPLADLFKNFLGPNKAVPRHAYLAVEAKATAWSAAALSNAFHPNEPRTVSLW